MWKIEDIFEVPANLKDSAEFQKIFNFYKEIAMGSEEKHSRLRREIEKLQRELDSCDTNMTLGKSFYSLIQSGLGNNQEALFGREKSGFVGFSQAKRAKRVEGHFSKGNSKESRRESQEDEKSSEGLNASLPGVSNIIYDTQYLTVLRESYNRDIRILKQLQNDQPNQKGNIKQKGNKSPKESKKQEPKRFHFGLQDKEQKDSLEKGENGPKSLKESRKQKIVELEGDEGVFKEADEEEWEGEETLIDIYARTKERFEEGEHTLINMYAGSKGFMETQRLQTEEENQKDLEILEFKKPKEEPVFEEPQGKALNKREKHHEPIHNNEKDIRPPLRLEKNSSFSHDSSLPHEFRPFLKSLKPANEPKLPFEVGTDARPALKTFKDRKHLKSAINSAQKCRIDSQENGVAIPKEIPKQRSFRVSSSDRNRENHNGAQVQAREEPRKGYNEKIVNAAYSKLQKNVDFDEKYTTESTEDSKNSKEELEAKRNIPNHSENQLKKKTTFDPSFLNSSDSHLLGQVNCISREVNPETMDDVDVSSIKDATFKGIFTPENKKNIHRLARPPIASCSKKNQPCFFQNEKINEDQSSSLASLKKDQSVTKSRPPSGNHKVPLKVRYASSIKPMLAPLGSAHANNSLRRAESGVLKGTLTQKTRSGSKNRLPSLK